MKYKHLTKASSQAFNITRLYCIRSRLVILILASLHVSNTAFAQVIVSDGVYYSSAVQEFDGEEYEGTYESAYKYRSVGENEILKGLKSSFAFPLKDLWKRKYDTEWKNIFAGFSGGFGLGYPLSKSKLPDNGERSQGDLAANNVTFNASLKYKLLGNWFISGALIDYANTDLKNTWHPEFVYTLGYSDWRPYTLSLVYANYGGNRLKPDKEKGEVRTKFNQGSWTLGWKFPVPQHIANWFVLSQEGRLGCNMGFSVVPVFFNSRTSTEESWKRTFSFGCKYTIVGSWYFNMTTFYYPKHTEKQPWNADYTYGFGYFNWRPGKITVQYNNYSGNRWPWNDKPVNTGRFKYGGISIAWSWVL